MPYLFFSLFRGSKHVLTYTYKYSIISCILNLRVFHNYHSFLSFRVPFTKSCGNPCIYYDNETIYITLHMIDAFSHCEKASIICKVTLQNYTSKINNKITTLLLRRLNGLYNYNAILVRHVTFSPRSH